MGAEIRHARALPTATPDRGFEPLEWSLDALCQSIGHDLFFVDKGQSTSDAKALCSVCTARADCLAFTMRAEQGVGHSMRHGISAGLSPKERAALEESGWQAGDPLPLVKIRGQRGGTCPHCGVTLPRGLPGHIAGTHPGARGAA